MLARSFHTSARRSLVATLLLLTWASPARAEVELNINIGEQLRYLDPQLANSIASNYVTINLFEGLFDFHPQSADPVPALCASHSRNDDASVWEFKLRDDIFWVQNQSGTIVKKRPIVAKDFIYSYRRILSPDSGAKYASMLYVIKNAEALHKGELEDPDDLGIEAVDDKTLRLTLEGAVPSLIQYLTHRSYHPIAHEAVEAHGSNWTDPSNAWTSGPFVLSKNTEKYTEAEKNPFYRSANEIQIDRVRFWFLGTGTIDAYKQFRGGKIDIDMRQPLSAAIRKLRRKKEILFSRKLGTYMIKFNKAHQPLNDYRVRKALALAIPRKKVVRYVMKSGQKPAFSLSPDVFAQFTPPTFIPPEMRFDKRIAEARELLKEAGFPNGEGFPELTYLSTPGYHAKVAMVISKTWKDRLGINTVITEHPFKEFLQKLELKDYQVGRFAWLADMADPMDFLALFLTDAPYNNTGFASEQYDSLLGRARVEPDHATRNQLMEQAEKLLMDDLPISPVFNYTDVLAVHDYISGIHANKMAQHGLKSVRIDQAARKQRFAPKPTAQP